MTTVWLQRIGADTRLNNPGEACYSKKWSGWGHRTSKGRLCPVARFCCQLCNSVVLAFDKSVWSSGIFRERKIASKRFV